MRKYFVSSLTALLALPASALPLNGNREFSDTISGYSMKTYTENFLGEFPVKIVLDGDCDRYSDVDLNLFVYDNKGRMVAKSTSPVCYDEVTFTPKRDGRFEIVVKSQNSVADMKYQIHITAEFGEPGEQ